MENNEKTEWKHPLESVRIEYGSFICKDCYLVILNAKLIQGWQVYIH